MTRHNPDSLSLMEYSAGNLSEPHALCIKLHLDKCSHCRSRVDTLDSLGAVMMEQQPKVTVSESMFDSILSKIDSEPAAEPAGRQVAVWPPKPTNQASEPMQPTAKRRVERVWKRQVAVNKLASASRANAQNRKKC